MIPVNLITGFLGVGKTTLIRQLLQQHPAGQRWAVLVNEFGEIGVDGALLADQEVAIEEVAGGCLCCVAAPTFTVGLNRLIREQRPQRILIEPSGLGHPAQVLDTLRSPLYQSVLKVRATLCVMDARHLQSPRHREHPNFVDQIHLADILIANKADQYREADEQALMDFAAGLQPSKTRLLITERGQVAAELLDLGADSRQASFPEAHAFLLSQQAQPAPGHAGDWILASGQSDGYHRVGWRIGGSQWFAHQPLLSWLESQPAQRAKGLLRCHDGSFSYNRAGDTAEIHPIPDPPESRLQLIDAQPFDTERLDAALRNCLA